MSVGYPYKPAIPLPRVPVGTSPIPSKPSPYQYRTAKPAKSNFIDSGYIWAPYVPLQTTPRMNFGVEDHFAPCDKIAWTTKFPDFLKIRCGDLVKVVIGEKQPGSAFNGNVGIAMGWDDWSNGNVAHEKCVHSRFGRIFVDSRGMIDIHGKVIVMLGDKLRAFEHDQLEVVS